MKTAIKILKLLAGLIIIFLAALVTSSYLLRDQVAAIVLSTINKNVETKIDVGSFRLSFIRKFPDASLELRDIFVLSSPGFNKDEFNGINTDTLLIASSLSVDFNITDIINKEYDIERIGLKNGKINLFTDSAGRVNYSSVKSNSVKDSSTLILNLKRILLSDLKINYNNSARRLIIDCLVSEGRLSSKISGEYINLGAEAELLISQIKHDKITVSFPFNAGLELKMEESENGIIIKKGELSFEGIRFQIAGNIKPGNDLNLELQGENMDLSKLRKYLPEENIRFLTAYNLAGILKFGSTITGEISETSYPHIDLTFNLEKGSIYYSETGLNIKNIFLSGNYNNGSDNSQETSVISVKNAKASVGSSEYSGKILIRNLLNPVTEIDFHGRIYPHELKQMFNIKEINTASGFFDLDLRLKTDFWPEDSITMNDIVSLKPQASLNFTSFGISFKKNNYAINDVNGVIEIAETVKTRNLKFIYRAQKITVNGEFINFPEWATGKNVRMKADADLQFNKLDPDRFISNPPINEGGGKKKAKAFEMPPDMLLNIRLKIDSLAYKAMPATEMIASFVYRPGLLTFNSFKMKSLDGTISGNGFIAQNKDKSLIGKGIFSISDINITKTFVTFRNFGQDFIRAENLEGNVTGSLTLLLPLDSLLKPLTRSLAAEGHYIINNGSLINFEPVRELSSFIELSELENIRFEKLENDFFIRNNSLYIPQMDVNSSAADIGINGKHNFDNTYEYHLNVRLSELLSKKRKKNLSAKTEFGVIEDDGLGRTSLLLKIESKGDGLKVGYDVKAAGKKVKTSIKTERQTLKSILNKEYGLYKNDTLPEQKPAEKKTRFRISWDEPDTISKEPEQSELKKENALKSLFRKK